MIKKETCPDCGVGIDQPHLDDCDVALCPFCEGQRITCDCSELGESVWTGEWPKASHRELSYDEAVMAFHQTFEGSRAIPPQPNSQLSELRGTTWYLRNIDGPLARVSRQGEVRSRRVEE